MHIRSLFAVLAVALAAIAPTEQMLELWKNDASVFPSRYTHGAYAKDNRVFLIRRENSGNCTLVGLNKNGVENWTYPLGLGEAASMLTTTDDRIYIAFNQPQPYVIALNQDGGFLWQSFFTTGSAARRLTEMRIFGNDLLVTGTGRTVMNGTGPRPVLFSFNRTTGTTNYLKEYLIGGAAYGEPPLLRASGNSAYLLAVKPSYATALLKISTADGEVAGSYVVGNYKGNDFQVDSSGVSYIAGMVGVSPQMRKVNSSGVGNFPLVYFKPWGGDKILLSGGALFTLETDHMRKTRASDGVQLWDQYFEHEQTQPVTLSELRADQFGRIYLLWFEFHAGTFWNVWSVDPMTGNRIDGRNVLYDISMNGAGGRAFAVNSFGEVLTAGYGQFHDGDVYRARGLALGLAQPIEVYNDTYYAVEGETFSTTGNGVLMNDRYANPAYASVYKINGTGPVGGTLTMQLNGEFTYAHTGIVPGGTTGFRYVVLRDGEVWEGSATLNVVRGPKYFQFDRSLAGVSSTAGEVRLSSPGAATVVGLYCDSPLVSVPTSATVPAGEITKRFAVSALQEVTSTTVIPVTASLNGASRTANLTLEPVVLASIILSPNRVTGGQSAILTVNLNGKVSAPYTVTLSETSPYCSLPATAVIPPGASSTQVTVTTTTPPSSVGPVITATAGAAVKITKLTINP